MNIPQETIIALIRVLMQDMAPDLKFEDVWLETITKMVQHTCKMPQFKAFNGDFCEIADSLTDVAVEMSLE
jgi:hypothetical protein